MHHELIAIYNMYPMLADQKFWFASGIALAILVVIGGTIAIRREIKRGGEV